MIRIRRRTGQYVDRLRSYEVVLDGNIVGRINTGEVFEYQPTPGAHTLQLKIDWCGSTALDFEIQDDEVVDFECGGLSGYKLWFIFWISIFQRDRYLWLKKIGFYSTSDALSLTSKGAGLRNSAQAARRWRFAIRSGVLGWGLTTGMLFQIFRLITGFKDTPTSWIVTLLIFMAGGLCWGLTLWTVIRKRELM